MPTPDDSVPAPRRSPRRPLGQGPGDASTPWSAGSRERPPGELPESGGPRATASTEPTRRTEPVEHPEPTAPEGLAEPPGEGAAPDGEPVQPHTPEPVPSAGAGEPKPTAPVEPPGPTAPDGPAEPPGEEPERDGRFTVVLDNFEGPFDLLLQLISRHKLDVTEVALSRVTDEFMAHIRAIGPEWDLDQTTEFLVVAATLLDLKAARLLPAAEVEDEADLALLEARDLLFARLLQYRAYKRVAEIFAGRLADEARRWPRTVGLEPHHAELLPEVALRIGPEGFARLAVKAMRPRAKPQVYVEHIHAPLVSVREQAEVVVARLRERGRATFGELTEGAPDTLTVVARFLALLELYRERAVELDQDEALGELTVRWCGAADAAPLVTDEFDRPPEPEEERKRT
ncbi:segregation/condensation protein A [Streptomyces sp. AJS327]|uniref:segregation and condensation protein A n=1 Tax=Streptomyces sp. AJS327 TaxID=2545265 RepID=UPI0015DD5B69|nr:segregation/condensation protein A [Streptomyces sp. AJS327]MBA0050552.1 segregation/condensation protein A [Streptomyces sp. AJS327]